MTSPIVPVPTMPSSQPVARQMLALMISKQIRNALQQFIVGTSPHLMNEDERKRFQFEAQHAVVRLLHQVQQQQQIQSFSVDKVEVDGHKPFYEVNALPLDLTPGDPYIVTDDDGTESYQGIVLACDGQGWGLILHKSVGSTGALSTRVTIQPQFPMEYITIQVKQET